MGTDLFGFVLAGGKSTRMGTDKAAVSWNGRTLLEHALAVLRLVAENVFILRSSSGDSSSLGDSSQDLRRHYENYGAEVIPDIFSGCGPLGGIHAALSHVAQTIHPAGGAESQSSKPRLSLMLAVDTPFITPEFLAFLAERATASRAVVTTPEIDARPQPLCAVYSLDFLPIADKALKAGNYKIALLFPKDKTLVIAEQEVRRFAFPAEMFENLNTPEDLERARKRSAGTDL